jgi:hypothetical protein
MTLRPSLPRIFRDISFLLVLLVFGGAGATAARGQEGKPSPPKPGPVLEVKFQENLEKPVTAPLTFSLDPFYLIEGETSRVQVRRVQVALEFRQPEMLQKFDPQAPGLREVVYDFLVVKDQAHPGREKKEQEQVLANLVNRYLGQEAVSAVKVDQNFLLLR